MTEYIMNGFTSSQESVLKITCEKSKSHIINTSNAMGSDAWEKYFPLYIGNLSGKYQTEYEERVQRIVMAMMWYLSKGTPVHLNFSNPADHNISTTSMAWVCKENSDKFAQRTQQEHLQLVKDGDDSPINITQNFFSLSFIYQETTIIHELSHIVAGTVDTAYGIEEAQLLSKRAPNLALTNADNIAFFVYSVSSEMTGGPLP